MMAGGLTVTDARLDGDPVAIRCERGLIAEIGEGVAPAAGDEVIDAAGMLLVPPMVNGHTHAAMTLFRGFGDDLPLIEWLETKIWPAEAKLEPADVYWGTRLAAIEMIRSGTTRFFDIYWHGAEVARAVTDAGIRGTVGAVMIDGLDPARGEELRPAVLEVLDRVGEFGPLATPSLGPHAIYTVSRDSLEWLAEISAEREAPVQIHLSEIEGEVTDCITAHGMRPAPYLDSVGLLTDRIALGHGVWLDQAELELIAERGATVITNPAANMKLAVGGAFPYRQAVAAGVRLGLGTDGPSSNSNLDMFEELKLFALLAKHTAGDPSILPAAEGLAIARGLRSPLLGGAPLEPGAQADFLLLRPDIPELSAGELDAALAYAVSGSAVDTTVCAGSVLMRGGEVARADEVIAEVAGRVRRLTA